MKNKILLTIWVIGLVFIVGCGKSTTTSGSGDAPTLGVPAPGNKDVEERVVSDNGATSEPKSNGEVKEFIMTAKQWEFVPSTIEVNQGDTVKLKVTSTDVTHGFALSEFGINERLSPGKTVEIEFVADKKGTFGFFCSVPCGRGHGGMRGQLIVN